MKGPEGFFGFFTKIHKNAHQQFPISRSLYSAQSRITIMANYLYCTSQRSEVQCGSEEE
jgi:hypothetical protein